MKIVCTSKFQLHKCYRIFCPHFQTYLLWQRFPDSKISASKRPPRDKLKNNFLFKPLRPGALLLLTLFSDTQTSRIEYEYTQNQCTGVAKEVNNKSLRSKILLWRTKAAVHMRSTSHSSWFLISNNLLYSDKEPSGCRIVRVCYI